MVLNRRTRTAFDSIDRISERRPVNMLSYKGLRGGCRTGASKTGCRTVEHLDAKWALLTPAQTPSHESNAGLVSTWTGGRTETADPSKLADISLPISFSTGFHRKFRERYLIGRSRIDSWQLILDTDLNTWNPSA
jgi:hypothetical protein